MTEYKKPSVTVDAIIVVNGAILLIKRKNEPFKGQWAFPGGFVDYGESAEDAVVREVKEETGISIDSFKQFKTYSAPDRDPRGHTITIVYNVHDVELFSMIPEPGDDAVETRWFDMNNRLPKLAFDHDEILNDYLRR